MDLTPHPTVGRLLEKGLRPADIASAVGASERQVYRWAKGECTPLPVYERLLTNLLMSALEDAAAA